MPAARYAPPYVPHYRNYPRIWLGCQDFAESSEGWRRRVSGHGARLITTLVCFCCSCVRWRAAPGGDRGWCLGPAACRPPCPRTRSCADPDPTVDRLNPQRRTAPAACASGGVPPRRSPPGSFRCLPAARRTITNTQCPGYRTAEPSDCPPWASRYERPAASRSRPVTAFRDRPRPGLTGRGRPRPSPTARLPYFLSLRTLSSW
jgi:hypothetical protein